MKVRLLGDRILVRPIRRNKEDQVTTSGAIFETGIRADVIEIGTEIDSVKAGDEVIYEYLSKKTVLVNGEYLFLVKQSDIIAIVTP